MHDTPFQTDLPIDRELPPHGVVVPATDPADFAPVPPRFWWLKRIGVAVGVPIAALTVCPGFI